MARLSQKQRDKLPSSAFAGPGRSFPVHDEGHARFALYLAKKQGRKDVVKNIHKKWPTLAQEGAGQAGVGMREHFN